jgi:hypothetical protein
MSTPKFNFFKKRRGYRIYSFLFTLDLQKELRIGVRSLLKKYRKGKILIENYLEVQKARILVVERMVLIYFYDVYYYYYCEYI